MDYTFEEVEVGKKFIDKRYINAPYPLPVYVKVSDDRALCLPGGYMADFDKDEPVVRIAF